MRIAVLTRDPDQMALLAETIMTIGHECQPYGEGRALLRDLRQRSYELLVLDWDPPDMTGAQLLRGIRRDLYTRAPILVTSPSHSESTLLDAFDAGADDYVARPLRAGEMAARMGALLRRSYPRHHDTEMVFGPYRFMPQARQLSVHGEPVQLKHREFELALFLFQHVGRLLARDYLRESVWGATGPELPSRTLDTHISRLRSKLDLRPENGFLLSAVYGLGYRLECFISDDDEAEPPRESFPDPVMETLED